MGVGTFGSTGQGVGLESHSFANYHAGVESPFAAGADGLAIRIARSAGLDSAGGGDFAGRSEHVGGPGDSVSGGLATSDALEVVTERDFAAADWGAVGDGA